MFPVPWRGRQAASSSCSWGTQSTQDGIAPRAETTGPDSFTSVSLHRPEGVKTRPSAVGTAPRPLEAGQAVLLRSRGVVPHPHTGRIRLSREGSSRASKWLYWMLLMGDTVLEETGLRC